MFKFWREKKDPSNPFESKLIQLSILNSEPELAIDDLLLLIDIFEGKS